MKNLKKKMRRLNKIIITFITLHYFELARGIHTYYIRIPVEQAGSLVIKRESINLHACEITRGIINDRELYQAASPSGFIRGFYNFTGPDFGKISCSYVKRWTDIPFVGDDGQTPFLDPFKHPFPIKLDSSVYYVLREIYEVQQNIKMKLQ